jgi:hypothetical protein
MPFALNASAKPSATNMIPMFSIVQIALDCRGEYAEHGSDRSKRQRRHAPPELRRPEQIENDANEAVDGDFGHDAAHQRRHMARRGGMSERQPDMQGNKPCLRSGAQKNQSQHEAGLP